MIEIVDETILYSFNNIQLSIIGTYEEPWFVAKEIATLLGYSNVKKAIQNHIKSSDKISLKDFKEKITENGCGPILGSLNLNWQTVLISEFGLYDLIFNSNMPVAEEFKQWVKSVLKEIRLKGRYQIESKLADVESKLVETERQVESKQGEIRTLSKRRFLNSDEIHIKLSDRIIALGFISSIQKSNVFKKREATIYGRKCKVAHPDLHIVEGKILALSNQLSNAYKKVHKKNPNIESSNRQNLYTLTFYEEVGDSIINKFFENDSVSNWEVDWNWMVQEQQAPEFNQVSNDQ